MNSSADAVLDTPPRPSPFPIVESGPDFLQSPLLTPWTDPLSGITSHLLTASGTAAACARIAPVQQSFYYVNPSLWLPIGGHAAHYWFYCAFPPANSAQSGRTLAVADFIAGTLRHFPETAFTEASPMLDHVTGEIYWANGQGIWKRTADSADTPHRVAAFAPAITRNRPVRRYATHLTLSPDRRALNIDAAIGPDNHLGQLSLNTARTRGEIEIWQTIAPTWNHAQFNPSPRHPGLQLLAQENCVDPLTGSVRYKDNRLWLIRRDGVNNSDGIFPVYPHSLAHLVGSSYRPVASNSHLETPHAEIRTDPRQMHGHEWWSADGDYIYYVHYQTGIERTPLATAGTTAACPELVWPHRTVSHAHTSPCGNYLVLDALPPDATDMHHVRFVNLRTRRSVDIVSQMPAPPSALRSYHLHPHPQFCGPRGEYVCYTMIQQGRGGDVAFVRVSDLVVATT
ncbi:hypothetical protein [Geminisphaera colitermitum]|uniref:hypothetical protein n=1 Tax=Geminisphaera colitermitum TaxID=1148786 RepID=UPI001E3C8420|nr:hypothetical protein [Geminisphaera colitermitum]